MRGFTKVIIFTDIRREFNNNMRVINYIKAIVERDSDNELLMGMNHKHNKCCLPHRDGLNLSSTIKYNADRDIYTLFLSGDIKEYSNDVYTFLHKLGIFCDNNFMCQLRHENSEGFTKVELVEKAMRECKFKYTEYTPEGVVNQYYRSGLFGIIEEINNG